MDQSIVIGLSNEFLVEKIQKNLLEISTYYRHLVNTDITFGKVNFDIFADKEMSVEFLDSVRGKRVYLVCSTESLVNEKKLALSIDAAKNARAKEIIAVIPYFGYARQDKKSKYRGNIGARVSANTLIAQGLDAAIIVELHSIAIEGMFSIPVENISLNKIFTEELSNYLTSTYGMIDKLSICSPDQGGVERALKLYRNLPENIQKITTTPIIIKHRTKINEVSDMEVYGDVKDRIVILVDDMADTAGTITKAADIVIEKGAEDVIGVFPHGIFSNDALKRIDESSISTIFMSDTHEDGLDKMEFFDFKNTYCKVISAADTLSKHIYNDHYGFSTK